MIRRDVGSWFDIRSFQLQFLGLNMNRFLEILCCLIAGTIALPFFLAGCVIVLFSVGRPLFFGQRRAGCNGRVFRIWKLRTMSDTRDQSGALLPDSERQTKTTKLLRRVRLDEMPQLVIILRGDMALVGPRPLLPETIEEFGDNGRVRCTVRPGLTGWAQVSGNTALSNDEKLKLDLWYVAHRSLSLDLKILFETIMVALAGEHKRPDRIQAADNWLDSRKETPA
ncbi:Sugar transferase involved in LPS biosynthesis (colanic, teichoic acid) [Ruegeria faecimaris]|uniref:Sugar transferase involved in LPS biosynthesis (Colanic, teichoic acid) n=2 Tax=Ruegeria faecimaris TaxID=686389 RepID=A0A521CNP8_9RHOB|nr:Sugar transferase involved in LPS biosynthesis (colanic, teichoic acid) [Ruegeria faecimaris]